VAQGLPSAELDPEKRATLRVQECPVRCRPRCVLRVPWPAVPQTPRGDPLRAEGLSGWPGPVPGGGLPGVPGRGAALGPGHLLPAEHLPALPHHAQQDREAGCPGRLHGLTLCNTNPIEFYAFNNADMSWIRKNLTVFVRYLKTNQ